MTGIGPNTVKTPDGEVHYERRSAKQWATIIATGLALLGGGGGYGINVIRSDSDVADRIAANDSDISAMHARQDALEKRFDSLEKDLRETRGNTTEILKILGGH